MKSIKLFAMMALMAITAISCSKDDTAPVITITSPTEGQALKRGESYPLTGTVTDDTELAEINAGGVVITTFDSSTSHAFSNINLNIALTDSIGPASIVVTATDKEGNVGSKTVSFVIE